METPTSPEELDEQLTLRKERFRQIITDIRAVLRDDLPVFVEREAKAAFLAHPETAANLSGEQVRDLKQRAKAVGERAVTRLEEALSGEDIWLEPADEPADARSLVAARGVWNQVRHVEEDLSTLLREFGLVGDAAPSYKAPVYFVGGRYFPALAEHYWKLLGELRALETKRAELDKRSVRERLETRWNEA